MLRSDQEMTTRSRPVDRRVKGALPPLDGRVRSAKRIKIVVADLCKQFPDAAPEAIGRCAEISVAAEMARGRLVRGEPGAVVSDTIKLENLAARLWRNLQAAAKPAPKPADALRSYLRGKQQVPA